MELTSIFIGYILFIALASLVSTLFLMKKDKETKFSQCFIGAATFFLIICVLIELVSFVVCLLGLVLFDCLPFIGNSIVAVFVIALMACLYDCLKSKSK